MIGLILKSKFLQTIAVFYTVLVFLNGSGIGQYLTSYIPYLSYFLENMFFISVIVFLLFVFVLCKPFLLRFF